MAPPADVSVAEWADENRFLSPEANVGRVKWRTRPYQREPMETCWDPKVRDTVLIWASQVAGKSEIGLNLIGAQIDLDPGPIMVMAETVEKAAAYSQDRFDPMVRDTPALVGKIADRKSRDSGNTIGHKKILGGHVTFVGANSPVGLSMRPIRVLVRDEVAAYPKSAGKEGNPAILADRRLATYDAIGNSVRLDVTSPRVRGDYSETLWLKSDQRRWIVPCPECRDRTYLKWNQVQWDKDTDGKHVPATAMYVCEFCGVPWSDLHRDRAIRKGEWVASMPFDGVAGFHLPAHSALGVKLGELAGEWLDAQGKNEDLQVFVNTRLAEWWDGPPDEDDSDDLYRTRREAYGGFAYEIGGESEADLGAAPVPTIPDSIVWLTASVDIQGNRLEALLDGWGLGEESWTLEHVILWGDPSSDDLWDILDEWLLRPRYYENGLLAEVQATCVDTGGHFTEQAVNFCAERMGRRVWGIVGKAGPKPVWPRRPGKSKYGGKPIFPIGVDTAKETIYKRLEIEEHGPGYIHFPLGLDEEFFKQLRGERRVPRVRGGVTSWAWIKRRDRQEALDLKAYSYAALRGLVARGFDLARDAARLAPMIGREGSKVTPAQAERDARRGGSGGWLGGRRRGWLGGR